MVRWCPGSHEDTGPPHPAVRRPWGPGRFGPSTGPAGAIPEQDGRGAGRGRAAL